MDHWTTSDGRPGPTGGGGFPARCGRYVLIVAYPCPWAYRALMALRLEGLSGLVDVIFAQARMGEDGWCPAGDQRERLASIGLDVAGLRDVYRRVDPRFSGRADVPVLWDTRRGTIASTGRLMSCACSARPSPASWTRGPISTPGTSAARAMPSTRPSGTTSTSASTRPA